MKDPEREADEWFARIMKARTAEELEGRFLDLPKQDTTPHIQDIRQFFLYHDYDKPDSIIYEFHTDRRSAVCEVNPYRMKSRDIFTLFRMPVGRFSPSVPEGHEKRAVAAFVAARKDVLPIEFHYEAHDEFFPDEITAWNGFRFHDPGRIDVLIGNILRYLTMREDIQKVWNEWTAHPTQRILGHEFPFTL